MDGQLDEFRIYNRELSADEVALLYSSNLKKYDTNKWLFTNKISGLADGTYGYTGYIADTVNLSATTGRTITIDTTAPTFTFSNNSTTETSALSLNVTSASDAGTGLDTTPYNFSYNGSTRSGWTASSSFSLGIQNDPTSIGLRVKVRDKLGNESSPVLATGTWTNIAPTANAVSNSNTE